jgi:exodeoxyribonuclease V gamma subunit
MGLAPSPPSPPLLRHRLDGRPTRANFRTGHLTVCALTPMRSVPHRVVCLLGLDDGVFPRQGRHDGDNLLLLDPQPGDRNPRAEDRQLLLDALLAAQDALIITYTGHDERTNAPRPPAVPVGELLDAIGATAQCVKDVVISHPLQPFDPRNFGALQGPWSFDQAALEGARAFSRPRHAPPPFLEQPLPSFEDDGSVTLDQLVAFVERPVRAFLGQRLGVSLQAPQDEVDDALPIELDALQRWGVGQRLLDGLLTGADPRSARRAENARGRLPPGTLGMRVIEQTSPAAEEIARHALAYAGGWEPRSLETNLVFGDGTRLTGTVSGVRGSVLLSVSYSRLDARKRIAAWVRFLALTAAHPELPIEAVTVGRAPAGARQGADEVDDADVAPSGVAVARLPQLGADPPTRAASARIELERLLALRADGLREPLPLPCLSAEAYAVTALRTSEDPVAAAAQVWSSRFGYDGEDREPEHLLAFGGVLNVDAMGPRALELWRPLLSRETVEPA